MFWIWKFLEFIIIFIEFEEKNNNKIRGFFIKIIDELLSNNGYKKAYIEKRRCELYFRL